MKKYIQFLIVLVLALTVVVIARNDVAWASSLFASGRPSVAAGPLFDITIGGSGKYTVGGLCTVDVAYKGAQLKDKAAVDVPAETSRKVTFSYPDNLYLSGCHITHYKQDKVAREMTAEDGNWEVCFGDRPDETLTIYYYPDDLAAAGKAAWLPLPTTLKNGFVCAPASYTGVYAPAGIVIPQTGATGGGNSVNQPQKTGNMSGTIRPFASPSSSITITEPGTYTAGDICSLIVDYYVPALTNELHVENNIEVSANVPFPDNQGLLYLPGCHVFHYKKSAMVDEVTTNEGSWKICFAAVPNKKTTIYFYYANNDINRVTSVWSPLETTIENGMACAGLTDFTGVYTPTAK